MSTNLAAVLTRAGEVALEERAVPTPGPGQALVEIAAVGVCGSDVHYYRDGRIGTHVVERPLVLGHEASGTVVGLGPGCRRLQIGQRVALEPGIPCRRCRACRSGAYNLCPDVRFFATPPVDGAFCRYVVHDEDLSYPLPDSLSSDAGALLEPLSVGIWASWKAGIRSGDRVLVTGAGPIGLLAAAVARASGAVEVSVTDVSSIRLDLARKFGATDVSIVEVGPASELLSASESPVVGGEWDVLIECSGQPRAAAQGLAALRPGGRAVLVGMAADAETLVPTQLIQTREIALTGTFRYANTYPTAIELATSGMVDLDGLVTGHYGLHEVDQALNAARRDPSQVKPMVLPASSPEALLNH